jgi:hypothetical protein
MTTRKTNTIKVFVVVLLMGVFSHYANQMKKPERSIKGYEISHNQLLLEQLVETQGRIVNSDVATDGSLVLYVEDDGYQFLVLASYDLCNKWHLGDFVKIIGVVNKHMITAREISVIKKIKERVIRRMRVLNEWAYDSRGFGCHARGVPDGFREVAIITDADDRVHAENP